MTAIKEIKNLHLEKFSNEIIKFGIPESSLNFLLSVGLPINNDSVKNLMEVEFFQESQLNLRTVKNVNYLEFAKDSSEKWYMNLTNEQIFSIDEKGNEPCFINSSIKNLVEFIQIYVNNFSDIDLDSENAISKLKILVEQIKAIDNQAVSDPNKTWWGNYLDDKISMAWVENDNDETWVSNWWK